MAGRLTTHVLDTAHGCPAAYVEVAVWHIVGGSERRLLKTVRTNSDGRTDEPLLQDDDLIAGCYELVFRVGPYFAVHDDEQAQLPFLDEVPVRFGIADPTAYYHVPLLVSPWSYSTYRGS
ncbi:MAG: hydroxyisourate hydrolase [Herpetosiphonaceae bacterium]|nr:hydroxyisourate hydrolase [Herpetosiphonaceae bacterium]